MFFRSLGSVLICGCTSFWSFLAILFLCLFFFQILLFIVPNLWSKKEWAKYRFFLIFPVESLHVFYFILLFLFLQWFWYFVTFLLPFYLLPCPVVPVVWVSVSSYLPALVVVLTYFSVVVFIFWGPIFDLLFVLFKPIDLFLVSLMWPGLLCICMSGLSRGHAWNNIFSHRRSVHTQIWYKVLTFHCICNFHILGKNLSPCQYPSEFMSGIVFYILIRNMVWMMFSVLAMSQETFLLCIVLCLLMPFFMLSGQFLSVPFDVASCLTSPSISFIFYLFVFLYSIYCVFRFPFSLYTTESNWHSHTQLVYHQAQCWSWEYYFFFNYVCCERWFHQGLPKILASISNDKPHDTYNFLIVIYFWL